MNITGDGFNAMLQQVADLAANSSSFQTWVGAEEETGEGEEEGRTAAEVAQDFIFAYEGPEKGGRANFLIVDLAESVWETMGVSTEAGANTRGGAVMVFEGAVASGDAGSNGEAIAAFMEDLGPIIISIVNAMNLGGVTWPFKTCRLVAGPARSEGAERKKRDYCQAIFELTSELGV